MVILAFPGLGKTPLAKQDPRYMDLDFGYFRSALNVRKEDEAKLLKPFAKLAKSYEDDGYIVLTNEPKLLGVLKVRHMYLPSNLKYSARKMGVGSDVIQEWVDDWAKAAKQHQVPVTYIKVGLDHYLKKGGHVNEKSSN